MSIISGEREIDACCSEVYENVFMKIQSQKDGYLSKYRNDFGELEDAIMRGTGKMFTELIKKDTTTAEDTSVSIIYSPSDEDTDKKTE